MTDPNGLKWEGSWIWSDVDEPGYNYWLCLRKAFSISSPPSGAALHITADSRYRVWVSGELVGQGPVRCWPSQYRYDTYDVGPLLRHGQNSIAVLVHEFGVGNAQYIPTRPGLLAQINIGDQVVAATDRTWRYAEHHAYSRETMRAGGAFGWTESYDANLEPTGWQLPDFDDTNWEKATRIGPPGTAPWSKLLPRDVPFLTEEPLLPKAVLRARAVKPPHTIWSVSLRRNMVPDFREAPPHQLCGFLATVVDAGFTGDVEIEAPGRWLPSADRVRVNGLEVTEVPPHLPAWVETRRIRARFRHGPNLVLWDVTGRRYDLSFSAVLDAPKPMSAQAPGHSGADFATISLPADDPRLAHLQACRDTEHLVEEAGSLLTPVAGLDVHHDNVTFLAAFATEAKKLGEAAFRGLAAGEPVSVEPSKEGDTEILLDFGTMTIGYWELELDAHKGTIVDLLGYESIQDGVHDFPWEMHNTLRYKCRDNAQRFRAFWRRGCRYLLLTIRGHQAPVTIRSVRTVQATYPVQQVGSFRCDDELLNRVWDISAYTLRLCMEDTYTDCPTYEQTCWVGDARPEAMVNYYTFGAYDISARCLRLAALSMERSDLVESHVPSATKNIIPGWSFLWSLAVEEHYMATGDDDLLDELYPWLVKQAERCVGYLDERGLFSIEAWNLVDWAEIDQPDEGVVTGGNLWLAASWQSLCRLARRRGDDSTASEFSIRVETLLEAINTHLWSQEKRAYVDCLKPDGSQSDVISQQVQILALLCGCATGEREVIASHLTDPPPDMVRVGTPFFAFHLFEALAQLGKHEEILAYMRKKWGFMLEKGATTCWEMYPGYLPGGRWTRSHCHAWSAAPAYFLGAYQLGVRATEPAFRRVIIKPEPAGLKRAEGGVPTRSGPISVRWEVRKDGLHLSVELPEGIEAEVHPPEGYRGKPETVTGSREFRFTRGG
jgi:alpha-L-rhamnosidase